MRSNFQSDEGKYSSFSGKYPLNQIRILDQSRHRPKVTFRMTPSPHLAIRAAPPGRSFSSAQTPVSVRSPVLQLLPRNGSI
jgi:hypothetical protein